MTQQEKQAIEDAAKTKTNEYCVSSDEVLSLKRSVIHDYLLSLFIAGAQFLDELRKPSERPNIKDFFPTDAQISDVHDEITAAPRLYAYMQALDSYIDSLCEKPSEPETNIGESGKELVKRICEVLDVWERTDIDGIHSNEFNQVATEIAALMQPDKELLEALKKICRVAPSYIKNPDDELDNAICEAMLAVYNYEEQSNINS